MGTQELIVILLIAFLIFDPPKVIAFAKKLGEFIYRIKKQYSEVASNLEKEVDIKLKNK
jgi:Sec-independent protein translocase protein TatA